MNEKIEKFDLQYYKSYLNACTYGYEMTHTEICAVLSKLIAEIERLEKENEKLKTSIEIKKFYEDIQVRIWAKDTKEILDKITKLQRVVECVKKDYKVLSEMTLEFLAKIPKGSATWEERQELIAFIRQERQAIKEIK